MKTRHLTQNQLAEQAGNTEMHRALQAMQRAPTQGERVRILIAAFLDVSHDTQNAHTLAGAAVALIAILDRGMEGVAL